MEHFTTSTIAGLCPSCRNTTEQERDSVIKTAGNLQLAHGVCTHCGITLFVMEIGLDTIFRTVGVLTELQRDEVETLWGTSVISEDDVIGIHADLTNRALTAQLITKNE